MSGQVEFRILKESRLYNSEFHVQHSTLINFEQPPSLRYYSAARITGARFIAPGKVLGEKVWEKSPKPYLKGR